MKTTIETIAMAILEEVNWTGHTLRELISGGRCVPASAKQWAIDSMNANMKKGTLKLTVEEWVAIQHRVEAEAKTIINKAIA